MTTLMKQKIIDFLNLHHKRAWCMNDKNYDVWMTVALENQENGNGLFIELKSYETNNGQTQILDLDENDAV
jgi:hypothetical protein